MPARFAVVVLKLSILPEPPTPRIFSPMAVKKSPAKPTKASTKPASKAAAAKARKSPAPSKRPARAAPAKATKPAASKVAARKPTGKKPAKVAKTPSAPAKKAAVTAKAAKPSQPAKQREPAASDAKTSADRNRERHTPPVFKVPSKKSAPIVFSLEDVREVLKSRKATPAPFATGSKAVAAPARKAAPPAATDAAPGPIEIRKLGAASLADLLGGRATARKPIGPYDEAAVPPKWKRYFKLLIDLRQHVIEGLELHTQDTLLRSSREDSGDLSGYGQHMADAGTETFDRDFALSLVSSEQEALAEIEAALARIFNGTYGVCEITGKPIAKERLEAVPFTRYSLEGQAEFERQHRRHVHRGGLFLDASVEDAANFSEDDGDE